MGSAGTAALTAARRRLAIRRELATTPGRLRLAAVLLTLGAIVFGIVAANAAGKRRDAVSDVGRTETLLVSAVDLSASLSNAHAITALSFLVGGPEPAVSRRRYRREMNLAAIGTAELSREVGPSAESGAALGQILSQLQAYSGQIDSARANNRLGYPVGSAYLRRASKTMRTEILPAARDLYEIQAENLTAGLRSGVSARTTLAVVLAACGLLALLAGTQVFLARTTHRVVNVCLAAATVVLVALGGWIVVAFALQQQALGEAQRTGSDPVELLTAARILALRAQADESIALSARGGGEGEPRLKDVDRGFQAVVAPIGRSRARNALASGGLLHAAAEIAEPTTARIDAIYDAYRTYRAAHRKVVAAESLGNFTIAVGLAVRSHEDGSLSTKQAADALNAALVREVGVAQRSFERELSRAESALGGLAIGIPVLTVLCAGLALLGVRRRLDEYR